MFDPTEFDTGDGDDREAAALARCYRLAVWRAQQIRRAREQEKRNPMTGNLGGETVTGPKQEAHKGTSYVKSYTGTGT